jgi:hypothetical protein
LRTRLHNTRSVARFALLLLLLMLCLRLLLLLWLLLLLLLLQGAVTRRPVNICWQRQVLVTAAICSEIYVCCRIGMATVRCCCCLKLCEHLCGPGCYITQL